MRVLGVGCRGLRIAVHADAVPAGVAVRNHVLTIKEDVVAQGRGQRAALSKPRHPVNHGTQWVSGAVACGVPRTRMLFPRAWHSATTSSP